jgi:hypothetical protein
VDHGLHSASFWQSHRLPDNGHAVTPQPETHASVGCGGGQSPPGGAVPLQIDCGSRPSGLWTFIAHCIALRRHNRPSTIRQSAFSRVLIRPHLQPPSQVPFFVARFRPRHNGHTAPSTRPSRIPISRWPSSHHIPISDSGRPGTGVCVSLQFDAHVPMCPCPLPFTSLGQPPCRLSRAATILPCDASHLPHLLTGQIHHPQDTCSPQPRLT